MKMSRTFVYTLKVLLFMILTLMALGAGVRTMNAGLSCPDWPLCFGKIVPDFHPAVWFEFVHRAYAGLVALVFFACCIHVFRSAHIPRGARYAAIFGLVTLTFQIVMGGLTVLWLVKSVVVTMHLMLATLFFSSVLWILFLVNPSIQRVTTGVPILVRAIALLLPLGVLTQILIGGLVASTYAGSVCVDWPLCNGQWVPTWQGAIGLQIIHRFVAYALATIILVFGIAIERKKSSGWVSKQILSISRTNVLMVLLQVGLGVANLLLYIPGWMAVLHQSAAVLLLAVNLRFLFVVHVLSKGAVENAAYGNPGPNMVHMAGGGGVSG